ncbi:MAG: type I methionyl aminopeptidase [Patescibacteria group bacterium]
MIKIKSQEELDIMVEGGKITAQVRAELLEQAQPGVSTWELEELAERRIREQGGEPGFKRVEGYSYATCINVNEGLVHGIPSREITLQEGDLVSVDLGTFYKGFHTDAAWTTISGQQTAIGDQSEVDQGAADDKKHFLETGQKALKGATQKCVAGNHVGDVSATIQRVIESEGYNVVRDLVGHGVGEELHEDPQIPCFGLQGTGPQLRPGMTLAIEVLYAQGESAIITNRKDGWTICMRDGSLSAIFENTIAVTNSGPRILTAF